MAASTYPCSCSVDLPTERNDAADESNSLSIHNHNVHVQSVLQTHLVSGGSNSEYSGFFQNALSNIAAVCYIIHAFLGLCRAYRVCDSLHEAIDTIRVDQGEHVVNDHRLVPVWYLNKNIVHLAPRNWDLKRNIHGVTLHDHFCVLWDMDIVTSVGGESRVQFGRFYINLGIMTNTWIDED